MMCVGFVMEHVLRRRTAHRFDVKPCVMVEVKPGDIRCHTRVEAIIYKNVGDDDGTSWKHLTSLLCLAFF